MTIRYTHNDGRSQVIRALKPASAHAFVVHPDGAPCEDGCDKGADAEREALYHKAFEELDA